MKFTVVFILGLTLATSAVAQHAHGTQKGPNGGPMDDVAGVHAELVTSGNTITLNIFDEAAKPIATKGFTGSALVVRGSQREAVTLTPVAENALKGETKSPIGNGAAVTVTLKTAAGKSGQVRFKP